MTDKAPILISKTQRSALTTQQKAANKTLLSTSMEQSKTLRFYWQTTSSLSTNYSKKIPVSPTKPKLQERST